MICKMCGISIDSGEFCWVCSNHRAELEDNKEKVETITKGETMDFQTFGCDCCSYSYSLNLDDPLVPEIIKGRIESLKKEVEYLQSLLDNK